MFLNSGVNRGRRRAISDQFLVIMLTTPPSASEPYSEDMGPRTTPMRLIASTGIQSSIKIIMAEDRVTELTRLPSISPCITAVQTTLNTHASLTVIPFVSELYARHLFQDIFCVLHGPAL